MNQQAESYGMVAHKFPDGVKDYKALVTGGYHFVDKTMMIGTIARRTTW